MRIEVTQDDIDQGERADCGNCPVARALERAGLSDVLVSGQFASYWEGEIMRTVALPGIAHRFVSHFDLLGPEDVAPFSFDLVLE